MPGIIPHLIAGSAMAIIGRYYFKSYFDGKEKTKEKLLLAAVCLSFSILPDFLLVTYYSTKISAFEFFLPFHNIVHIIIGPIAIVFLIVLKYGIETKRKPIWAMGLWSILLHLVMDLFILESSIWI
jgi:uncharacterized membrane-anchored protein